MSRVVDAVVVTKALVARVRELGLAREELEAEIGAPLAAEDDRSIEITTAQFFALWRAVEGRLGHDRALGLRMGIDSTTRGFSVATTAALHAEDLREALVVMGRYKRLMCPETIEIEAAPGEASVRFHWILGPTEVPRLLVDGTFAGLVSLARVGTGTFVVPRRIELARPRADVALLEDLFRCPIVFDAPFDKLVVAEADLARPFVTRDADALAALVPDLEAALADRGRARTARAEVRMALARTMSTRPSIDKLARRLATSARTLQRRLGEEGTSYQRELDEVRRVMAARLLARTRVDPLEIAFLLGFEEPNSFARAFRGWEGKTPLRYRAEMAFRHP